MITQIILWWSLCSVGFLGLSIGDNHYAPAGDQHILASIVLAALSVALYLSLGDNS